MIAACGGDLMVRREIFEEVGGFDPIVVASEDEEFCQRVAKAGYELHRIPEPMTRHDLAMTTWREWWKRCVRSGHGFAQTGQLHPGYFGAEKFRALVFGLALPLLALIFLAFWPIGALLIAVAYGVSWWRTAQGLTKEGLAPSTARHHATYYTLAKFPHVLGMGLYHWRRLRGSALRLVEYK